MSAVLQQSLPAPADIPAAENLTTSPSLGARQEPPRPPPLVPDGRAAGLREKLLAEAHAAGRMGASRLSDGVLFGGGCDPSDTLILQALDAFDAGRMEREP